MARIDFHVLFRWCYLQTTLLKKIINHWYQNSDNYLKCVLTSGSLFSQPAFFLLTHPCQHTWLDLSCRFLTQMMRNVFQSRQTSGRLVAYITAAINNKKKKLKKKSCALGDQLPCAVCMELVTRRADPVRSVQKGSCRRPITELPRPPERSGLWPIRSRSAESEGTANLG